MWYLSRASPPSAPSKDSMRLRFAPRLRHRPALQLFAAVGFVALATAWLDARAQEAEVRGSSPPLLWWPFGPHELSDAERAQGLKGQTAIDFRLPDLRTGRPVALSE